MRQTLALVLRPVVTALLVVSLLFPAVLGALASPALTPEQALLRDIGASLCQENEVQGQGDRGNDGGHECQHCVLCALPAFSLARLPDAFAAPSHIAFAKSQSDRHWLVAVPHPLSGHTGPPRGPPILV